jgi:AcrR family transcriptional regulator
MALAGKTKQDIVSEFRSAEILGAARKVFALKGFSDATMDEIAAAAGIAKGTIYLYFPTKRDIYLAALKEGLTELRERTNRNMEAVRGIRAKLRGFITTRIEYAETNRDFIRIYHSEFGNLTKAPLYDSEFQQLYLQQAEDLKAVLQAAVEGGEIRNVRTEFMAFMIYDMVKGVMTQRLLEWSQRKMEEDIQLVDDLLWKGLAPA